MRLSKTSSDMRHLSVPSADTAKILETLRDDQCLPKGARIIADPSDESRRLIPIIDDGGALNRVSERYEYPIIEAEQPDTSPRSYREQLDTYIGVDEVERLSDHWPMRHEILGDLILVKIPEEVLQYEAAIAQAMLAQHTRIRMVMKDEGVSGEYRVRQLTPLAERVESTINVYFDHNPDCRTQVKESGYKYWVDPTKAYFSARLSKEREDTIASCQTLREKVGHKLRICDPYAGVGPALVPLLAEDDLIELAWGSDLNPDAVVLMEENLSAYDHVEIQCKDALSLATDPKLKGQFDVLLINIPHSTLSHLASVIPLLKESSPTLLRGWVVVEDNRIAATEEEIREIIPTNSELEFSTRRSYSVAHLLCRFEVKINH